MTIEEIKKVYGDPREDGYISCLKCPLFDETKDECTAALCSCDGMEKAWNAIQKFHNERGEPAKKEQVNHPDHYNQGDIECIDAMIAAFGVDKVCDWCVMTSFKYHWRYQHKNGEEDINKASWYIDKYKELKNNEKS